MPEASELDDNISDKMNAMIAKTHAGRLAAAVVTLAMSAPFPALAQPGAESAEVGLQYESYLAGIHSGSLRISAVLTPERYGLVAKLGTRGIVHLLVRYSATAESAGRFVDGRTLPDWHRADTTWRRVPRRVENSYAPDGTVENIAEPAAADDNRDPVPPELMTHTIDPLSAALRLVLSTRSKAPCDDRIPVFDGRRRYTMILRAKGEETIDTPVYQGAALHCILETERIVGFSRSTWLPASKAPRQGHFWLADIEPDLPSIPVRFQAQSGFGRVVVNLVAVTRGVESPQTDSAQPAATQPAADQSR